MGHKRHTPHKNPGQKNGYKILRNKMTARVARRDEEAENLDQRFVDFSRIRNIPVEYFS